MQPIFKVILYVILFFLLTNFSCSVSRSIVYATYNDVLTKENTLAGIKQNVCKKPLNYVPDIYHPEYLPTKYLKFN